MASHRDRMHNLFRFRPPYGSPRFQSAVATASMDVAFRKEARRRWEVAFGRCLVADAATAGFPVDACLREFVREYNSRLWEHGFDSFPSSFNVLEAFVRYNPEYHYLGIRPERDHLVNLQAFLDWATSAAGPDLGASSLRSRLDDGVIHHYNICDDPTGLAIECGTRPPIVVGGASLVRHGDELTLFVLAGERTSIEERTREVRADNPMESWRPAPGKEGIAPAPEHELGGVAMIDGVDVPRCLLLMRIDLKSWVIDARYALRDIGPSYLVSTDDPDVIDDLTHEYHPRQTREMEELGPAFNLCRTLLLLPEFFAVHAPAVRREKHPTALAGRKHETRYRKAMKFAPTMPVARDLSVLDFVSGLSSDGITLRPPQIAVESRGRWVKLRHGEVGVDKNGQPIYGRTWVEERTVTARPDYGGYLTALRQAPAPTGAYPNRGWLYVMRNPAHEGDVYKVGLTRRTPAERAADLTGSTSSPTPFLVVFDWEVSDCDRAEAEAHAALSIYRLNQRREFFRAPLAQIADVVRQIAARFPLI